MSIFTDLRILAYFKRLVTALEQLSDIAQDRRNEQIAAREARRERKRTPVEMGSVDWDAVNMNWKRERQAKFEDEDEDTFRVGK